jgi:hypothetical protein
MGAIITDKIKRSFLTQLFDEATGTKLGDSDNYYYIGVGRSNQWPTDDTLVEPDFDEREEREFRYGAQSVKAIEAFSFVIPIQNWEADTQYVQYNDNVEGHPSGSPYYVRTADNNNVYVCIRQGKNSQGAGQVSTVKPDHVDTTLPVETDGYVWKYLYTISTADTNFFVTANYMPVKLVDSAGPTDPYFGQKTIQNAAVPGQIIGYRVTANGTGYDSATTTLSVIGDGTGAAAHPIINTSGQLIAVEVGDSANVGTSGYPALTGAMGSGYNEANVRITSPTGSNASVVPVFAHRNGLGADPREDLRATAMMFHIKPEGTVDNTWVVGGQDYRQVALWRNPLDSNGDKFTGTSGIVAKRLTLTAAASFDGLTSDKQITGDSNAVGWIDYIEDSTVWYHQDETTGFTPFRVGEPVDIDGDAFTVALHKVSSDIDRHTGDLYFINNGEAQPRTTASTDDIKLVIQL